MAGPKRRSGSGNRLTATKAFIAVGALASTLVGWTKLTMDNPVASPTAPPPPTDVNLDFAPLPTLIPAPDFSTFVVPTAQPVQAPPPAPTLRHVSAPSGGGGGGGGGGSHSVASTHSSR
jgi:hypothetical protein